MLTPDASLSDLAIESPMPGLWVLPAVPGDDAYVEPLVRRLPALLAEAANLADYVVVDTPPLGSFGDAQRLADLFDGLVMVGRPGHTDRHELEHARAQIERSSVAPMGLVLSGTSVRASDPPFSSITAAPAQSR